MKLRNVKVFYYQQNVVNINTLKITIIKMISIWGHSSFTFTVYLLKHFQ